MTRSAQLFSLISFEVYKEEGIELPVTTHFAFSVFEEVGHGANSNIPCSGSRILAVDMGAMGDDQQTDEYTVSICVKDASGPYHYEFRQHLVALAKEQDIPFKLDIYPFYGSDASAAMSAGAEVKHALLGAGTESVILMSVPYWFGGCNRAYGDAYLKSTLVDQYVPDLSENWTHQDGRNPYFVKELETGYVVIGDHQYF